jgi:hypothetical protein
MAGGGMDISGLITGLVGELVNGVYRGLDYDQKKDQARKQMELAQQQRPMGSGQAINQVPMLSRG